ncbi:MAG: hypothetical protein IH988_03490 [Planctomycetes bacterium]|nr:hypothetical protein [Planctomycetota bacterium]
MKFRSRVLAFGSVALLVAAVCGVRAGVYIGGTPIHTEYDLFSGAGFEADVFSFVYAGVDSDLPDDPLFVPLNEGETLFVYFMRNVGDTGDVDLLGLLNPAELNPSAVGVSSLAPDGWLEDDRVNPVVFEGSTSLVQYQWDEFFSDLLAPGDWAVMFYRVTGFWQPVDGFVGLGSDLDSHQIPGPAPIPEPAAVCLLLAGMLVVVRRRARRA